jgi:hypothetical protein
MAQMIFEAVSRGLTQVKKCQTEKLIWLKDGAGCGLYCSDDETRRPA